MIKITGEYTNSFTIELDMDSCKDIMFDKMKREESDELIRNAIYKKYGDIADEIFVHSIK